MNYNWSLESIYKSINDEVFKRDLNSYIDYVKEFNLWCEKNLNSYDNVSKKLEDYVLKKNNVLEFEKIGLYLNLLQSCDTQNDEINKLIEKVESVESNLLYSNAILIEFLKGLEDIEKICEKSEVLKEHKFYLLELKGKSKHTLSPKEEAVIGKMKSNGSLLLEKLAINLTSNLMVEFNGKKFSLSEIRNMAYSEDENIRKNAYFAEIEAYKEIEVPISYALNGIKGEVINCCKMKGYKSPLEMTLLDSRIDREILDAMFLAIEKNLDKLTKYFKIKARALNRGEKLPFYDLFAPIGFSRNYSVEEAIEFVKESFYEFSKDLGDFACYVFEKNWVDFMPKKGKVGGAFCESIHQIKESRILLNFGGKFDDIITLAHELGHAFHNSRLFKLSSLNSFYPMPIAETASTFCEALVVKYAMKKDSRAEKVAILESDIMGLLQCIVDIYSRFLFEDEFFKRREDGFLSSDEIAEIMVNAQKRAYKNGLDEKYLHRYMWVCKPHYYDREFNYYNFPYAFGALLSKGLFSLYKEKGDSFISLYDKFLENSSIMNLDDVAKIAGIDIRSSLFWEKGISEILIQIDYLNEMLYND